MTFPLNCYERKKLKEFEKLFEIDKESSSAVITFEEYLKYQDWIELMRERGYLIVLPYDNGKICNKMADFSEFNKWKNSEDRKAKRLKRRDWIIAIAGALAGAIGTVIAHALYTGR